MPTLLSKYTPEFIYNSKRCAWDSRSTCGVKVYLVSYVLSYRLTAVVDETIDHMPWSVPSVNHTGVVVWREGGRDGVVTDVHL